MKAITKNKVFEVEEIVKFICCKDFGETINYEDLQQFTNYNLDDELEAYRFKANIMRKVKNKLIDEGYILKSIRNVGYYILKPNQIQSFTYRTYITKSILRYEKAEIILKNTKTTKLNDKELNKHKLTQELNSALIEKTNYLINLDKYEELKK